MTRVPGGTFQMGCDEPEPGCMAYIPALSELQKPVHAVTVAPFDMDLTEVTTEAYTGCVNAGKCTTDARMTESSCNYSKSDRLKHPINCVDHEQATTYCAWVGKRLPTEEEGEFAARGTDGRKWPWGNDKPSYQLCWQRSDAGSCAVGSFPAGVFGLFDMAGNVAEWTSSTLCPYSSPGCKDARFVVRSAGWNSHGADSERGSSRSGRDAKYEAFDTGFRCARDASGAPPPPAPAAAAAGAPKQEEPGKGLGANATVESLTVNGVRLKHLECRVEGGLGILGVLALVAGLGERKAKLDTCSPGKESETPVSWTATGGKLSSVKAEGPDAARNRCVETALAGAQAPTASICKASIIHGR
jgi:hypothetical protein